ncbi:hypothetical protein BDQ17DRAFT_358971 [Cyathus striatus]|nr:hypothetical protein BDQ17DRAFT_358971 [Cyathus striatus]
MASPSAGIWNSTSTRSAVPNELHSSINQALKDIKIFTRRLQLTLITYSEEAQVLERIYYKGKNQHRTALFWRRVEELRKCCRRVSAFNILPNVRSLRCSFFGPDAATKFVIFLLMPACPCHVFSLSLLKGSWTHLPNIEAVSAFVKELAVYSHSLEKMRQRIAGAYQLFAISMQSAAFLQALVILAAIACRLHALSAELLDTIQLLKLSCNQVLQVINHTVEQPSQNVDFQCGSSKSTNVVVQTVNCLMEVTQSEVLSVPEEPVERFIVKHDQLDHSVEQQVGSKDIGMLRSRIPSKTKKNKRKTKPLDEIDAIFSL